MNTGNSENQNKRYRKKYKYMKMRIKSLILENAALCDEVAKVQESILIVKDERRFLLHKLLEYENENEIPQVYYKNDSGVAANGPRTKIKKRLSCDDTR
ncbi:unnamed protein product [Spodoptera exigua]|uniref:INO80 complex subunit E N-terminal domain-containing protein n=1 Tax=Spodoptera exigua TaxID=7107 RepID=A0A922M8N9_SPOEX|nr:hypothetical protein HF086_010275 [Spodoptera exigua]CAH0702442.1 unnamed protein product [Spodoptera exigua]